MSLVIVPTDAAPVVAATQQARLDVPVRRLRDALDDLLDLDQHPEREPEHAMAALRLALAEFHQETRDWLVGPVDAVL